MKNRKNTIQKDLVRNAVYEMKRHVTANEIKFLDYDILFKGICLKCSGKEEEKQHGQKGNV